MPKTVTILSNDERHLLGGLPEPRNIDTLVHEFRSNPFATSLSPEQIYGMLSEAQEGGFVRNIGSFDKAASAVAKVRNLKDTITLHDEHAAIFSRRMAAPQREWRVKGDLWILTRKGWELLHEPVSDSPPMTPSQIQTTIDREWARTVKDVAEENLPDDLLLVDKLLPSEFMLWASQVADESERIWNVRPRLPMAGGVGWSDAYENTIIDAENQKASITAAANWWMALTTVAITDSMTGATITEATYTGYVRKSVAPADMAAAAAGSSSNANAIVFAACTGGSSAVIGFANTDNATTAAGTVRKYGASASTTVSTTQTPAQFAAGSYTTTAD